MAAQKNTKGKMKKGKRQKEDIINLTFDGVFFTFIFDGGGADSFPPLSIRKDNGKSKFLGFLFICIVKYGKIS